MNSDAINFLCAVIGFLAGAAAVAMSLLHQMVAKGQVTTATAPAAQTSLAGA